ncbi:MAG: GNAT family N-acetyltransferase [Actinomycetota bacterium]|nr:GNAT family N-acetyltransferase [Actinomycetota bacterium]
MLKGNKVLLRPVTEDDLETIWPWDSDIDLVALADDEPPLPRSFESFREQLKKIMAKPEEVALFAIEADGSLIGTCSLFHFDVTAHNVELGIFIGDRSYWGRGYGREAIGLLLEYAFRFRNQRKVYLGTFDDNERAIRSYRACGFVEEGRLREHSWVDGRYKDLVHMGIMRSEWAGERGAAST